MRLLWGEDSISVPHSPSMDAMKRQAQRSDLTSVPVGQKLSRDELARQILGQSTYLTLYFLFVIYISCVYIMHIMWYN